MELKNDKQEQFCKEYLIDLNATQAAIRAGYSEKTARQQGQRLLTKVDIQNRIAELKAERSRRIEITADMVVQEIAKIAFSDLGDFMTWNVDGEVSMLPQEDIDTAALQSIKSNRILRPIGEDEEIIDASLEVKLHPKMKALELLYKHTNGSDALLQAQLKKAQAEGEILQNTADKLTNGNKVQINITNDAVVFDDD